MTRAKLAASFSKPLTRTSPVMRPAVLRSASTSISVVSAQTRRNLSVTCAHRSEAACSERCTFDA